MATPRREPCGSTASRSVADPQYIQNPWVLERHGDEQQSGAAGRDSFATRNGHHRVASNRDGGAAVKAILEGQHFGWLQAETCGCQLVRFRVRLTPVTSSAVRTKSNRPSHAKRSRMNDRRPLETTALGTPARSRRLSKYRAPGIGASALPSRGPKSSSVSAKSISGVSSSPYHSMHYPERYYIRLAPHRVEQTGSRLQATAAEHLSGDVPVELLGVEKQAVDVECHGAIRADRSDRVACVSGVHSVSSTPAGHVVRPACRPQRECSH